MKNTTLYMGVLAVIAFMTVVTPATASDNTFTLFRSRPIATPSEPVTVGSCSVVMYKVGAVLNGDVYIVATDEEGRTESVNFFDRRLIRRGGAKPNLIQKCPLDTLPVLDEIKRLGCVSDTKK